ncbi:MAG: AtpZ/AtpI family protein [Rickettsiales bacterium]
MNEDNKPLPSLEDLQRKIDEIAPKSDDEQSSGSGANIGKAMKLGTELLAGVGVGGILGYYIDLWLDTLPLFFILFFFLGFAAGVKNILRTVDKTDEL